MQDVKSLTSLRFLAAATVLLAHTFFPIASLGLAPMTVFFCLSGFVLTWSYGDDFTPGRFFQARFARIYPLYALLLLLDGLQTGYDRQTLADALLVQAWQSPGVMQAHLGVAWSLSVEAFFYASFPFVTIALRRLRTRGLLTVAGGCLVAAMTVALTNSEPVVRFFPPARLADFVFGCVLARIGIRLSAALGPLLVALLVATAALPVSPLGGDVAYLPTAGLLILWLSQHGSKLLEHRFLVTLGTASYALYLCHVPLRNAAFALYGHSTPVLGVVVAVSLAASLVLCRYIEQPARRAIRSWPTVFKVQPDSA